MNPFFDPEPRERCAELGDRIVLAVCCAVAAIAGPDVLTGLSELLAEVSPCLR